MNTSSEFFAVSRLRLALALVGLAVLTACASSGHAPSSNASTPVASQSDVEVYGVVDTSYRYSRSEMKLSK